MNIFLGVSLYQVFGLQGIQSLFALDKLDFRELLLYHMRHHLGNLPDLEWLGYIIDKLGVYVLG